MIITFGRKVLPLLLAADRDPIIPPKIVAPINIAMKKQIGMTNLFFRYQGRLIKMLKKLSPTYM